MKDRVKSGQTGEVQRERDAKSVRDETNGARSAHRKKKEFVVVKEHTGQVGEGGRGKRER